MTLDIQTDHISLNTSDNGTMGGYLAYPTQPGKYPAVLVWMEIFGINAHIQDVTRRLAKEGYIAFAPDFYHRQAPDIQLEYNQAGIEKGKELKAAVTQKDMIIDAKAAIAFLQTHERVEPKNKLASIGFCFGGYIAYVVATLPEIAVTASLYGSGIAKDLPNKEEPPVDKTDEIRGYMLCLYGENDVSIPQEDIQLIESSLERAKVPHEMVVYPDADHGFFCDQRASYNPEAALSAWDKIIKAFKTQLQGVTA